MPVFCLASFSAACAVLVVVVSGLHRFGLVVSGLRRFGVCCQRLAPFRFRCFQQLALFRSCFCFLSITLIPAALATVLFVYRS